MRLKENYFLYLFIVFVVLGGGLTLFSEKTAIVLFINHHLSHPVLDVFFKYWTYFGDGLIYAILLIIGIAIRYYYAILFAATAIIQTAFVHIFKQWLFKGAPRPLGILPEETLHLVNGVDVHHSNSFPSGHTATAFSVFFLLAIITGNNKWASLACFFIALLVGISRVYLLQHFFIDIYFGAIFGVLATICALWATRAFSDKPKLMRGLIR